MGPGDEITGDDSMPAIPLSSLQDGVPSHQTRGPSRTITRKCCASLTGLCKSREAHVIITGDWGGDTGTLLVARQIRPLPTDITEAAQSTAPHPTRVRLDRPLLEAVCHPEPPEPPEPPTVSTQALQRFPGLNGEAQGSTGAHRLHGHRTKSLREDVLSSEGSPGSPL